ncbi:MAG: GNAT family N-acetyltransferase [Thermoplasmata archaeon]|jgi:GNAT superfamily N-acetyltransferase
MKLPERISIRLAKSDRDWVLARSLLLEYLDWLIEHREVTAFDDSVLKVGVDDFHQEVASLPGPYGPPRGSLFLAFADGMPVGCGALKSLGRYRAEIKRIYIRPSSRGSGLGRRITRTLVNRARALGYQSVALDTLPTMTAAIAIYRSEGFEPIPRYWPHPVPDALFFGKELRPKAPASRRKPK